MKRNLLLNICVLSALFISTVYAQEVSEVIEEVSIAEEVVEEKISEEIVEEEQEEQVEELEEKSPVEPFEFLIVSSEEMEGEETQVHATSSGSISTSTVIDLEDENVFFDFDIESVPASTPSVDVLIRNGADVLYEGEVSFEEGETVEVVDTDGDSHDVPSNSALAVLLRADLENKSFEVTDIQYYASYNALYLKCIKIGVQKYCDNWQYVINNMGPWTSIDASPVSVGDSVGFYFGTPYQVVFDTSLYVVDVPFVAYAQQYDYLTNTWNPRAGVTLGLTVPNPDDVWIPIELETHAVGADGGASFVIATSGAYSIGIVEDYYYPSYSITVATSTDSSTGGSGNSDTQADEFDVDAAIAFLKSVQGSNGSYGGSQLYSDWAGVAFGAVGQNDSALMNYFKSTAKVKNLLTDNERRAMALLALGKNPYDFEGTNYVEAIIEEFDGTQFGEKDLVNDDIFALVVLSKVGYESDDEEVAQTIKFILKEQNSNGSWEGSTDLTGAGIQALSQFNSVSGVSSAISKAKTFLKNTQQSDGGWGSTYSTSWVMQVMSVFGEDWNKNNKTGAEYLAENQQEDGGVLSTDETEKNRIWATSYAIPAVLGLSWDEILNSVSKPNTEDESESEVSTGGSSDTTATSTATTTFAVTEELDEVATTTLATFVGVDVPESSQSDIAQTQESISSPEDNSEIKKEESEPAQSETIAPNQLATANQIPWLQTWWMYLLGGLVLVGGVWSLKKFW